VPVDFSDPEKPVQILVVAGDGQNALAGSDLDEPLVVRVVGENGRGIEGVTVRFAAPAGDAFVPESTVTDQNGHAEAVWR
jgi:hypothetical protein